MRTTQKAVVVIALLLAGALPGAPAGADPPEPPGSVVRAWNDLALDTARATSASDAHAARLYAMVNVAMYDAVNGVARGSIRRDEAMVAAPASANGDPAVAASVAARDVLVGLYPDRAAFYDARLESDLAAAKSPGASKHGRAWGAQVAAEVLAARSDDGSTPVESQPGGSGAGVFAASWSGVQFRNLTPFAIAAPDTYVSTGPPALDSAAYTAAFDEVKELGNAAVPDAAKLETFQYWSLGARTSQPPGAWVQVAQTVSEQQGLRLSETARLFALATMAMVDTVAPTYKTKFVYHFWRPTTAIRGAGSDGNPDTAADPTWSARAGSVGSSPEHWSGHSSFSAAAAEVLAGFFCNDDISFDLVTDSAPGAKERSYPSFSAGAAEAGRSRVLGGFHFEFSNQAGLIAGRAIADEVLAHALLLSRGPTHTGDCPL